MHTPASLCIRKPKPNNNKVCPICACSSFINVSVLRPPITSHQVIKLYQQVCDKAQLHYLLTQTPLHLCASYLALQSKLCGVFGHWTSLEFPHGSHTSQSRSPEPAWWSGTHHLQQDYPSTRNALTAFWSPMSHLIWSVHRRSLCWGWLLDPSRQGSGRSTEHHICMSKWHLFPLWLWCLL